MNPGKIFEADFHNSFFVERVVAGGSKKLRLPRYPGVGIDRVYDNVGGYAGVSGFCDFTTYLFPNLFYFELKSTQEKSLSFDAFTEKQLLGLCDKAQITGIVAGALIQWRAFQDIVYFLPILDLYRYMQNQTRKSIPFEYCVNGGYRLYETKKRTRYSYDVFPWLLRISGREEHAN